MSSFFGVVNITVVNISRATSCIAHCFEELKLTNVREKISKTQPLKWKTVLMKKGKGEAVLGAFHLMYGTLAAMWYLAPASKSVSSLVIGSDTPWNSLLKIKITLKSNIRFSAFNFYHDIVWSPHFPIFTIIVGVCNFSAKYLPTIFIKEITVRQKRDFTQCHLHEKVQIHF